MARTERLVTTRPCDPFSGHPRGPGLDPDERVLQHRRPVQRDPPVRELAFRVLPTGEGVDALVLDEDGQEVQRSAPGVRGERANGPPPRAPFETGLVAAGLIAVRCRGRAGAATFVLDFLRRMHDRSPGDGCRAWMCARRRPRRREGGVAPDATHTMPDGTPDGPTDERPMERAARTGPNPRHRIRVSRILPYRSRPSPAVWRRAPASRLLRSRSTEDGLHTDGMVGGHQLESAGPQTQCPSRMQPEACHATHAPVSRRARQPRRRSCPRAAHPWAPASIAAPTERSCWMRTCVASPSASPSRTVAR